MNKLNFALLVVLSYLIQTFHAVNASDRTPVLAVAEQKLAKSRKSKLRRVKSLQSQRYSKASWYGSEFHGKRTASGQKFDMYAMSAAHKTLPLLSYAKVTNLKNHRSVIVRINDRGPFHGDREMDLSYAAAKKLGIRGVEAVSITPLDHKHASSQSTKIHKTG